MAVVSETRLSFEASPFPVAAVDATGTTVGANRIWRMLGPIGSGYCDALDLDALDRSDLTAMVGQVIEGGTAAWIDVEANALAERRWARCHAWTLGGGTAGLAVIPLRPPRDIQVDRDQIEQIERILEHTADAVAIIGEDLSIRYASGTARRFLGVSGTGLEGADALTIVFAEDHEVAMAAYARCIANPRLAVKARFRLTHELGELIWVEAIGTNMHDDPVVKGVLLTMHDITELVEARTSIEATTSALETEKLRYERLAQFTPTGVFEMTTDGTVVYSNERFRSLTGHDGSGDTGLTMVDARDRESLISALDRAGVGSPVQATVRLVSPHPDARWVTIRAVQHSSGTILGSIEDSSDQVARHDELTHRVGHDELTGLPNRQRLLEILEDLAGGGEPIAVLFIDLDNFKDINDGLGHQIGDQVLVELAGRIRSVVRPDDIVGRLHGDEFLVLCRDTADVDTASEIASRIVAATSRPLESGPTGLLVSASVGISVGDTAADALARADRLIVDADVAMYEAKRLGGSRSVLFTADLAKRASDRLRLHGELQRAASLGELEVHYQPIIELATGDEVRSEALLRWRHAGHGLVLPGRFIPDIERSELIDDIGRWVLDRVLGDIAAEGGTHPPVHVNVSPQELVDAAFARRTLDALDRHGVDGDRLTVEVTELVDLDDLAAVEAQLFELQRHGVEIAIDDFGTGFSTLASLQRFPFDQIKIDGRFIAALDANPTTRAIVAAIVDLAASIGAMAIAEKVERRAQIDILSELGCAYGQGYLLGPPAPLRR